MDRSIRHIVLNAVREVFGEKGLSQREMEVVFQTIVGKSQRGMAASMGVSANTVKSHLKTAYRKCDVASREELFDLLYK